MRVRACTWLLLASSALSIAYAADPALGWQSLGRAIYFIHGGTLADRQRPTENDRKLSIVIDGQAAKNIFDAIGPDLPETCSMEKGDRARDKKGVQCRYTAQDKGAKEGPFRCWIGLDLRSGDSVGTASC